MTDEIRDWLRLARAPGLHSGLWNRLPDELRSPAALMRATAATLRALGLPTGAVDTLASPDAEALERDERWLAQPGRGLVTWRSAEYPELLATIPDAPLVLYAEGDIRLLHLPQLAIVGARNPTAIGRETAMQFAEHLSRGGLTITSGLALGIDAASHRGALRGTGRTIAVLGCGLDRTYPPENSGLAREIADRGLLVSEFPPGVPPLKEHFPRRNRIISGLAVGTLVVEAALHSGSLITARLAADQGREVFAIPGSIHSPLSRGCHRLIRQGAKLVETADDIIAELGALCAALATPPAPHSEAADTQGVSGVTLDKDYEILLDALGFDPAGVDTLVARTGFTADVVASMLLILELEGRIQQQPGGIFCRRPAGK